MLGKGGAAATVLLVFMAVTSAFSAQLIAVSSIVTYDIYHAYINPQASGKRLVHVSHLACVFYAIFLAGFATGLYYAGISLGYLYLFMGVVISSAVLPVSLALMWKGQNWIAAAWSPILGLIVSLVAWLVTAKKQYGTLTVATTGAK
jgi:Na+/proline symporter